MVRILPEWVVPSTVPCIAFVWHFPNGALEFQISLAILISFPRSSPSERAQDSPPFDPFQAYRGQTILPRN